jgi:hypothetical protein
MILLEIISVRPMDKTPVDRFHNSDDGIKEYIKKNFQDTGKLLSMSTNVSQNYSTETKKLIFKSKEDYDSFANDDILVYQSVLRSKYNSYHNISCNYSVTAI